MTTPPIDTKARHEDYRLLLFEAQNRVFCIPPSVLNEKRPHVLPHIAPNAHDLQRSTPRLYSGYHRAYTRLYRSAIRWLEPQIAWALFYRFDSEPVDEDAAATRLYILNQCEAWVSQHLDKLVEQNRRKTKASNDPEAPPIQLLTPPQSEPSSGPSLFPILPMRHSDWVLKNGESLQSLHTELVLQLSSKSSSTFAMPSSHDWRLSSHAELNGLPEALPVDSPNKTLFPSPSVKVPAQMKPLIGARMRKEIASVCGTRKKPTTEGPFVMKPSRESSAKRPTLGSYSSSSSREDEDQKDRLKHLAGLWSQLRSVEPLPDLTTKPTTLVTPPQTLAPCLLEIRGGADHMQNDASISSLRNSSKTPHTQRKVSREKGVDLVKAALKRAHATRKRQEKVADLRGEIMSPSPRVRKCQRHDEKVGCMSFGNFMRNCMKVNVQIRRLRQPKRASDKGQPLEESS